MQLCDLTLVKVILDFTLGGVGLRALIALVKKMLGVDGLLASALSMAMCFLATAFYLMITKNFSAECMVIIGLAVYAGSQATYSLTKKRGKDETQAQKYY